MKKRIFSMLLALSMVLSLFSAVTVYADNGDGQITVVAGDIKNGQVKVSVEFENNPGIAGIRFELAYDNTKLVPASYEKGTFLGGDPLSNLDQGGDMAKYKFATYQWSKAFNVTADGTLLTVVFDVLSGDWEETALTIENLDVANQTFETLYPEVTNAAVGLPTFDFKFADLTKTYTGEEFEIVATNLNGATVEYENNGHTDAGEYIVTATAKKPGFRTMVKKATLTIEPKKLTITGLKASDKQYDATTKATITGGLLKGAVDGDDVSVDMPASGVFASKDAKKNVAVTIDEIVLNGQDKKNYILVQPTGLKATITAAPVTVTAKNVQKKKGADDPELTYTVKPALFDGDSFTGELKRKAGEDVGEYAIEKNTLALSSNYKMTFEKGTFTILDRTAQNIEVSEITDKTYGDAGFKVTVETDPVSKLTEIGFSSSNEDVATIDAEGNVVIKSAGTTKIKVTQAGNDDYAPFESEQTLTVSKKEVTVTANNLQKRLGADDPELTYTVKPALVEGDVFTGALKRKAGEKVGEYAIEKNTLALSSNYKMTFVKGTLKIVDKTPQEITLADIPEKTYGDGKFTVTAEKDAVSNLEEFAYESSNEAVATIDANGEITIIGAGETVITVTEPGDADYAEAKASKTLKVKKAPLTATVEDVNVTYGDEIVTNVIYAGFVGDDNESVLTSDATVSGYVAKPDAGEYELVASGASAANYEITYVNGTLTVNQKDITITELKVFDKAADSTTAATINASTLTFEGILAGDDVTVDIESAVAEFESADAGENITVNISNIALTGADAANYMLSRAVFVTTANIKAVITAADIAAQITAAVIPQDAEAVTLPNVPEGYTIAFKASNNEGVVKADGSIVPVAMNTVVGLTFTVTSVADPEDKADTAVIDMTVPAASKVNVTVDAGSKGTIEGDGEYLKNESATVKATPKKNYKFKGWYVDGEKISEDAEYTFKVTADIELVAKFDKIATSSGGGGSVSAYVVSFEANGGSEIGDVSVSAGGKLKAPEAPTKSGATFAGWYIDEELTTPYSFDSIVYKHMTLYAKWKDGEGNVIDPDIATKIILTIGQTETMVFGQKVENDVAPVIVNNYTMLPARLIAEALGATVDWNADERKVTITGSEVEIVIVIGSDKAYVNGEEIILEAPAFIQNNRTYTPQRFIAEKLGALVEWVPETRQVVITKK